jgi:hypothetical protein
MGRLTNGGNDELCEKVDRFEYVFHKNLKTINKNNNERVLYNNFKNSNDKNLKNSNERFSATKS